MIKRTLVAGALAAAFTIPASAQVRVVAGHFAPFADTAEGTSVTIQINGADALTDVVYGDFTDYIDLGPAGSYEVNIIPTGTTDPAISFSGDLPEGDYTLLAVGDGANQPLDLLALTDDNTPPAAGNIKIRVVHAAPFAPTLEGTNVSIRTAGGDVVGGLNPVPFGVASGYLELPAATYDLKVATPDGSVNLIDPLPVPLGDGAIVTVIANGDGVNQSIGIDALPVGSLPLRVPVDATATGVFFNPATPGQGAQILGFPRQNRALGFVYSFDTTGTNQAWYHFDTCNTDTSSETCATPGGFDGITGAITIYRSEGGVFNDATAANLVQVGTGTITFTSCDDVEITGDFGNGQGEVTLDYTRLGDRLACTTALQ
ncbi:MAG: DUF4397 domain-containing protein [Xanthomonadales bacterium]|nr:DUF4397 domain-containing protein [Xanthomonadales bacterium]